MHELKPETAVWALGNEFRFWGLQLRFLEASVESTGFIQGRVLRVQGLSRIFVGIWVARGLAGCVCGGSWALSPESLAHVGMWVCLKAGVQSVGYCVRRPGS